MGLYRTYFTKDTTLIKDKYVNTGLNPVMELVYGGATKLYNRCIFSFDIEKVKEKIEDKTIINNIKHTLNLTNTVANNVDVLHRIKEFSEDHASSFDLVLFQVPQSWDEGIGYDFDYGRTILDVNGNVKSSPANWFQRTNISTWTEEGIFSGNTSDQYIELETIHFDLGNENINVDITSFVNELITSGTSNFYGLGLAFKQEFEDLITEDFYRVNFYGKDTHTFFEPFIETTWEENILDDRNQFYFDKLNKLYLYTNVNKNPTNLDELPSSVIIYDQNDEQILILTGVTQEGKGVYSVELELSSSDYNGLELVNFTDVWTGLEIGGRTLSNVDMTFTLKDNNYFNIGNEIYEPSEFTFSFTGIKRGERINKGEVRKVIITAKEFFNNDSLIIDNIYYNIYIKQGNIKIDVIPETKVNRGYNQNYFYLDTSWMVTQNYYMDIIIHSNGTITKKDTVNFIILDGRTDNLIT